MNGVHEARFDNIDRFPTQLSNSKHIASPDLKRGTKREPLIKIKTIDQR